MRAPRRRFAATRRPRIKASRQSGPRGTHGGETMRFTLQSLGRLDEATIDLSKDLILLTGPNNTSKTYVAHSI
jgi:hypothetical protein